MTQEVQAKRLITITKQDKLANQRRLEISETILLDGLLAVARKKYIYRVYRLPDEMRRAVADKPKKDRHLHIFKEQNSLTGKSQMVYRIVGSFFIIQESKVFAVGFLHSISFNAVPFPGVSLNV